jgi:ATP-dependent Clp protease ATP-binding subunit ClpA
LKKENSGIIIPDADYVKFRQIQTGILARITEIIPFAINRIYCRKNFQYSAEITSYFADDEIGNAMKISDDAVNLALGGFSSKYGARQISGVIRAQLARPISKMIVRRSKIRPDHSCRLE